MPAPGCIQVPADRILYQFTGSPGVMRWHAGRHACGNGDGTVGGFPKQGLDENSH
ncbi:MAG: hypothetical protein OXC41_00560 [Gammaproteobacteria bacterium]|nr:hypothetical protein [Gammaproteobacteria bacterium]